MKKGERTKGIQRWFRSWDPTRRVAGFMASHRRTIGRSAGADKLEQELKELSFGRKGAAETYYLSKYLTLIRMLLAVAVAGVILLIMMPGGDGQVPDLRIRRPSYGEGDAQQELIAQAEGIPEAEGQSEAESRSMQIRIGSRQYTDAQAEALLEKARKEVAEGMLGENQSRDEVRRPLHFPDTAADGAVKVEWMTIPYGIVGSDGSISEEVSEKGTLTEVRATLSIQEVEESYVTEVKVFPPVLTEREQFWKHVEERVREADEEDPTGAWIQLPEEILGRRIGWSYPGVQIGAMVLIFGLLLTLLVYARSDRKVHEEAEKRKAQLSLDYSEVLWKLALLMGAGLTIRTAFSRVASAGGKEGARTRYVYAEMQMACREMRSGVPEGTAYEHFGRRCALPAYEKLGSLLSQNMKKGSKGLCAMLEKEAVTATQERKSAARKLGEQAGTKLLFPMILMFGVVLIILVVPAFLSL